MLFQCTQCKTTIDAGAASFGGQVGCGACGQVVQVPESRLAPGMILGDFAILELIRVGSLSSVHLANQISLQRRVALKVLRPEVAGSAEQVQGFVREARSVAKLNHPGIIQIYAVGDADGFNYFAMELVIGNTVSEILARPEPPQLDWSLDVCRKIALSLNHAQKKGNLIHRDIRPSNIMIRDDGAVKLSNLGLARSVEALRVLDGPVEGTPQYISPEAVQGQPMDFRSDIYSLGATLYHMATGEPPFIADTAGETAQMHVSEQLIPPHELVPEIPVHTSRSIMRMMEKDPRNRFNSLKDLAGALRPTTTRNTRLSTDSNRALRNRSAIMETQVMPVTDTDPTIVVETRRLAAQKKAAKLNRLMAYILIAAIVVVILMVSALVGAIWVKKRAGAPPPKSTPPDPTPTTPVGTAPKVDAGKDVEIQLPAKAELAGTVEDDDLIKGKVTTKWKKVDGPAPVMFSHPEGVKTTASFTEPGVYVLRLTADDTQHKTEDTVTITVLPAKKEPRFVLARADAGPDHWISIETGKVSIDAKASVDKRVNPKDVVISWSKVKGRGNVTFSNGDGVDTEATFSEPGDYILRLSVNDTKGVVHDDVTIHVEEKELDGPAVIAINCGGEAYTGKDGVAYTADAHFQGGKLGAYKNQEVKGTEDAPLYQTGRWNSGSLTYEIPLEDGDYQVVLKFAEMSFGKPGTRVFEVKVGGRTVRQRLDVAKLAEAKTAYKVICTARPRKGKLQIRLNGRVQNPMLSAIVVRAKP